VTRDEALIELRELAKSQDAEVAHSVADDILLALIGDPEIEAAYEAVPKWYA